MSKDLPPPTTLCPFLTAAALARPKAFEVARVVQIGAPVGVPDKAPESEAVACQGKNCMLYIIQRDPKTGDEVAGRCAITTIPIALSHLTEVINNFQVDPSKKN